MTANLFPKNVSQLESIVTWVKKHTKKEVEKIIALDKEKRTFANTFGAFDTLNSFDDVIPYHAIYTISDVTKDDALRKASKDALADLSHFFIDTLSQNKALYEVLLDYSTHQKAQEHLTKEEEYYIKETLDGFKKSGLALEEEKRQQVVKLKKELTDLSLEFSQNISDDQRFLSAKLEELEGLEESFINSLKKNEDGTYHIGTDYPTYFMIMEHGANANLRKNLLKLFSNRAYPANKKVLETIKQKRQELAQLLGFESYAHLNIDDSMAKTPENVEVFLNKLIKKVLQKEEVERKLLLSDLPANVVVDADNKIKNYDRAYINTYYKKKHFNIDDREIAKYFPMQKTVDGLLSLYTKFFDISIDEMPLPDLWDENLKFIRVSDEHKNILGYLILDLFPRPYKYTHACHITVIPSIKQQDGSRSISLGVVLANFTKPTEQDPSLLDLDEVRTFFHEFGHALHAILGATRVAAFAGTSVKTDFVEMPSQMLEQWLFDYDILKNLSSHYKTGEKLPDETIKSIIALKNFNSGQHLARQLNYAFLSLYIFDNKHPDIDSLIKALHDKVVPFTIFDPENHSVVSFDHLMGYGSSYYSYLWSEVFAHDLFATIKRQGLLNPEIGKKYRESILSPGGSIEPQELIKNFLGREPNEEAFLIDRGLSK